MKYILLFSLLLISCKPSLPEDDSNITSECDAPFGYDCRDINVLKSFIKINSQIGNYMDYNNNGVIDPLEFGYQAWDENGRLVTLDLNYSPNIIMKEDNPSEIDPANYRLDSIPVEIGRLTNLENFLIHDNEITFLPDSISLLENLKIIDFENNLLSELPEDIGRLKNLERLVLSYNVLDTLPPSIGNLNSLKKLWLQNNYLNFLPDSIVNLSNLEWLYINNNRLKKIPKGSGNLYNLKILNLNNNQLSSLPESMCSTNLNNSSMYSGLDNLSIVNNEFCDTDDNGYIDGVPLCIDVNYGSQSCSVCQPWEFNIEGFCADSSDYNILQYFLDLNPYSQSLSDGAGIPDSAKECINESWWHNGRLIEISFQHKQLSSVIPDTIGGLEKLKILRLTGNSLKGEIPSSITKLNDLEILKLNSNFLSGSLPQSIGNFSAIDTIWLTDNSIGCYDYDYDCDANYTGQISNVKEFCCITHCDMSNECSSGIPASITNLRHLQALQLEENLISGMIPENIGNMDSLKYLYLDNNLIYGEIPQSIGDLKILRFLKLHFNDLSGYVPESICNLYENDLGPQYTFRAIFNYNKLCPLESGYPECISIDNIQPQFCSP